MPRPDKSLYSRSRQATDLCGEKKIQALSSVSGIDDDLLETSGTGRLVRFSRFGDS